MRYAEVALNLPLRQSYTYHIPPTLDEQLAPGCLVRVQFGTTMEAAIVLDIHDTTELTTTKPIIEQLDKSAAAAARAPGAGEVAGRKLPRAHRSLLLADAAAGTDRKIRHTL